MKDVDLSLPQRVGLEVLWLWARSFAMLPYWLKFYVIEDLVYFGLSTGFRYRRQVIMRNLRNSFPEKSERELNAIRRGFYRTLAEVVVTTINMAGIKDRKVHSMISVKDVEEQRAAVRDRDWIAMTAHFGSWEYCSCWGYFEPRHMTLAVYHPLHSDVMECFYQRLRRCKSSTTVPMKESLLVYLRHREKGFDGKRMVLGLIADQNPPLRSDSHWFRFLNQDSVFFDGGEKLALRFHLPVFFVKLRRIQRGRYELEFVQIYDGKEDVAENEITARYVSQLEAMIRECPELWLWSHRRWKHKLPVAHADN